MKSQILIAPVLTEKATNLVKSQIYTFIVDHRANKFQIKKSLENLYKVKIKDIKTITRKGKKRKVGKRMIAKQMADKKIAFIKLKEGKIDLFPQA